MAFFINKIDAKGRIFVPAKVRDKFGKCLFVAPNIEKQYLTVYSEAHYQKLCEEFNALPKTDPKVRKAIRKILGKTLECETDGQGRISVSSDLWDLIGAQPNTEICIYQIGDMMEICTKSFYDAENEREKEDDDDEIDLAGFNLTAL